MTLAIIIITALVSVFSFQNRTWFDKLKLNPYRLYYKKEWGRILSHGFIHADWTHLIVNMFVLYSFGRAVEYYFSELRVSGYMSFPIIHFLLLYLGGIIISSIPSILKQKNHEWFNRKVGATLRFTSTGIGGQRIATLAIRPTWKMPQSLLCGLLTSG